MDDTISRAAAIDIVNRYNQSHMILKGKPIVGAASMVIEMEGLPSAERPTGEWVFDTQIPISGGGSSAGYRCSICGRDYFHVDGMNFCPNCGADMRGKE